MSGPAASARNGGAAHADIRAAGVPVTLLHYEQVNQLSAPFWSQQGYRPLWLTWEARPARAIRGRGRPQRPPGDPVTRTVLDGLAAMARA